MGGKSLEAENSKSGFRNVKLQYIMVEKASPTSEWFKLMFVFIQADPHRPDDRLAIHLLPLLEARPHRLRAGLQRGKNPLNQACKLKGCVW